MGEMNSPDLRFEAIRMVGEKDFLEGSVFGHRLCNGFCGTNTFRTGHLHEDHNRRVEEYLLELLPDLDRRRCCRFSERRCMES